MESLTKQFEERIVEFFRHTQLTPSEFGERAIRRPEVMRRLVARPCAEAGDLDRILTFTEA